MCHQRPIEVAHVPRSAEDGASRKREGRAGEGGRDKSGEASEADTKAKGYGMQKHIVEPVCKNIAVAKVAAINGQAVDLSTVRHKVSIPKSDRLLKQLP